MAKDQVGHFTTLQGLQQAYNMFPNAGNLQKLLDAQKAAGVFKPMEQRSLDDATKPKARK